MEKHIAGHTDKIIINSEEKAIKLAERHSIQFNKKMRAYKCQLGDHWHITTMSKGRYFTSQRKDPRKGDRASNIPE